MQTFDQRVLVGVGATLSFQFVDQDGDAADPGGTVTVDIVRGDGTSLVTAGATSGTGTAARTYALAAGSNTLLDWLSITWKVGGTASTTTTVEVVGDYWASVAAIKAAEPALASRSAAEVLAARWEAEQEADEVAGVSFVPRYHRARLDGTGTPELLLPHGMLRSLRSVRVYSDATSYTSWTAGDLASVPASTAGLAVRTDGGVWTCGRSNIVVEYEHGFDRPPADLLRMFYGRVRWFANRSRTRLGDDVTSFASPDGTNVTLSDESRNWFAKLRSYGVSPIGIA